MVGRDGRLIPMVACIGNHEVDGGYNKPRDKAPFFYALFDGLYPETGYATLDFGDYLSLVLLDTGHTTPIDGEQTDWLEKTLKERADHPHVIVVNHVPAYPSFRNDRTARTARRAPASGNRKHWVPLFEKYRVPVVLEHHDHTFKRTKPLLDGLAHDNGVLYLGDGSWGRLRSAAERRRSCRTWRPDQPGLPPVAAPHPGRGAVPPGPGRERPGDGRLPGAASGRRGLWRPGGKNPSDALSPASGERAGVRG